MKHLQDMKVSSFGRKLARTTFEKVASFRSKIPLFMSRLIKELLIIFPLLFLIIFSINIFLPKTLFEKTKEDILINPRDESAHKILARMFFEINDFETAQKEFNSEEIVLAKAEPEKLKKQILYWQKLAEEIPSYRDAYIQLSLLNSRLYRDFDAKKFLVKALELDPNSTVAATLSLRGMK